MTETDTLVAKYGGLRAMSGAQIGVVPKAQRKTHGDDKEETKLRKWCSKSFSYILRKKEEKSASSNTCMFLYGLNFDPKNPRLQKAAPVMALKTDIDHLQKALVGIPHKIYLSEGKAQIIGEIVDIFRCLFMLVIVYGYNDFTIVDWAQEFCSAYRKESTDLLSETAALLNKLYWQLRVLLLNTEKPLEQEVLNWIQKMLAALGAIARCGQITVTEVANEFEARIPKTDRYIERIKLPKHPRHEHDKYLAICACLLELPDQHGSYNKVLTTISNAPNYNVLASATTTVVWGETAKAKILFSFESPDEFNEQDIRTHLAVNLGALNKQKPIIVSFACEPANYKHIKDEDAYISYVSMAIKAFWASFGFDDVPKIPGLSVS